jgi:hypothetical protein
MAAGGVLGATQAAPVTDQSQGAVLGAEDASPATTARNTTGGAVLAASNTAPAATSASPAVSQLPFTGLDLGLVGGIGAILLLGGLVGHRVAAKRD